MTKDIKEVVVDADFFRKVTEKDEDGVLFLKIMSELGRTPIMHKYVYEYELADSAIVKKLVGNGTIKIYSENDYVADARAYRMLFESAYQDLNYKQFVGDVLKYHHQKENLGEIRSSILALYKGIDLFMSDDRAAKKYVSNKLSSSRHRIDVYSIYDTMAKIGQMKNKSIKWRDVKGMAKQTLNKQKYEEIQEIWHLSE